MFDASCLMSHHQPLNCQGRGGDGGGQVGERASVHLFFIDSFRTFLADFVVYSGKFRTENNWRMTVGHFFRRFRPVQDRF